MSAEGFCCCISHLAAFFSSGCGLLYQAQSISVFMSIEPNVNAVNLDLAAFAHCWHQVAEILLSFLSWRSSPPKCEALP